MKVKSTDGTIRTLKVILTASMISTGITFCLSGISGWMLNKEVIPQESIQYCSLLILMISSATGVITAGKGRGTTLVTNALIGCTYIGILSIINILFFEGMFHGFLVTTLLVLGTCTVVKLITLRGISKKARIKIPYRK